MVRSRSVIRSREVGAPVERVRHAQAGDLGDVAAVDADRQDLGPEPAALAGRAGLRDHELLELGPDVLRVRLLVPPLEVGHHPLERGDVAVLAALVAVADDDLLVLGGMEQELHRLLGEVLDRGVDAPAVRGEDRVRDLHPPRDLGRHLVPRGQGAVADGPRPVRDHEVRVHDELRPEAGARRARAVRRVEREAPGLEVVDHRPVVRAAVALREAPLLEVRRLVVPRDGRDDHHALAEAERGLDRVREPRGIGVRDGLLRLRVDRAAVGVPRPVLGRLGATDDEPVDDHLDRVALVPVERRRLGEVVLRAVDPHADEALLARPLEDPVPLGLAVLDQGSEDEQPGALREGQDLVDDLADRLALDLAAAVRAVGMADAGEQEPQVVVDLGDGPDRGPRVPAGALLVDGDRGRQAVDLVDVRLLHLAQELPGIGAQALDVAALALGVDGVEGEAGLAAPRQAGDHDQAVTREGDVDVLEVVLAGSEHHDPILGHDPSVPGHGQIEHPFRFRCRRHGTDQTTR